MKKIDSLNLIPFIDIMLVLLVIVLTSASFVQQSKIEVEIPKIEESAESSTQADIKEEMIVINKQGQYFVRNKRLDFSELKMWLERTPKQTQILIKGDRESGLEHFLEVSTLLQMLGFENVYVITQKIAPSE
ncbi:ExbD/TolR family protein [uncultured Helicobacter sp.]|uniref:ExbD/TolR family protein n=1 Tax=uncultured Helicobacter sp. TaxID=175537 RepID=UPI001C3A4BB3|nr:biopolymer transporter ExbD [Candidatus Helicobacter avicola]